MIANSSAPGKVILAGEHSVVYGFPAIAASVGLRCKVQVKGINENSIHIIAENLEIDKHYDLLEFDKWEKRKNYLLDSIAFAANESLKISGRDKNGIEIIIKSEIPISAGMGSSASVVVSTIASIFHLFSHKWDLNVISKIAFEAEKITHGTPSGIDNSIATYGGVIKFHNGKIEFNQISKEIPFIIVNSNVERNTKTLVNKVAKLQIEFPEIVNPILTQMGAISDKMQIAIQKNDLRIIGKLMDINHGLLNSIGVGHTMLDQYVWAAKKAGALGAKLTGAGGGGCMIAIAKNKSDQKTIVNFLSKMGADVISTALSSVGVRIE